MTDPTLDTPDAAPVSGPPAPRLPARRDAAEVAAEDFAEWWAETNPRHEGKLFEALTWETDHRTAYNALLKERRVALLVKWRAEGLTLDDMAERGNLSYSRIRELLPPELRPGHRRRKSS